MPVQVQDIIPEDAAQEEAPPREEAPQEEAPQEEAPPAPKRRGRPPGSKNRPKPPAGDVEDIEEAPKAKPKPKPKPKPPAEPVRMKRAVSKRRRRSRRARRKRWRTNLQARPHRGKSNGPTIGAGRWRPTRRGQSTTPERWTGCSAFDQPRRYSKGTARPCRRMAAEPCAPSPGTTWGR